MPSITIDTTIDIDASRHAVWRVLTDFPRYDKCNPSIRIEGTPAVGTKLVVHLNVDGGHGMTFNPKCWQQPPREELRSLGMLGIRGIADGGALLRPDNQR